MLPESDLRARAGLGEGHAAGAIGDVAGVAGGDAGAGIERQGGQAARSRRTVVVKTSAKFLLPVRPPRVRVVTVVWRPLVASPVTLLAVSKALFWIEVV